MQEKNEPPQNFPILRFYPIFPRFFTKKIFKVRVCERCGSLYPRLVKTCKYVLIEKQLNLKILEKTIKIIKIMEALKIELLVVERYIEKT